jgi:hypothetical protein
MKMTCYAQVAQGPRLLGLYAPRGGGVDYRGCDVGACRFGTTDLDW